MRLGPYMQYIFVRTKSILENLDFDIAASKVDAKDLVEEEAIRVLKNIYEFENVLKNVTEKNEPYLLSRYLIELAKNYSAFYNNYKIIVPDRDKANARAYLTYMVNLVLKKGASLLGIKMPDKM